MTPSIIPLPPDVSPWIRSARTDLQATGSATDAAPRFARYALSYSPTPVLIIYASLHPFSGWRDPRLPFWYFSIRAGRVTGPVSIWRSTSSSMRRLGFLLSLRRLPWRWLQFPGAASGLGTESRPRMHAKRGCHRVSLRTLIFRMQHLVAGLGALVACLQGDRLSTDWGCSGIVCLR